jgi:hypothetical protein
MPTIDYTVNGLQNFNEIVPGVTAQCGSLPMTLPVIS